MRSERYLRQPHPVLQLRRQREQVAFRRGGASGPQEFGDYRDVLSTAEGFDGRGTRTDHVGAIGMR